MSLAPPKTQSGAGVGGSNSQDNMDNIAEMIRTDSSMRQSFIAIAAQRDPALGQQLAQSLQLLDAVGSHGQSTATLTREDRGTIQRLTDLGFDKKQALVAYLTSNKNVEHATSALNNPENTKDAKATEPPAIGRLIGDNPALRQGLHEFIAQKDPALARQIQENPALFEAALRSAGSDGTGGEMPSKTNFLEKMDDFLARDENATLPRFFKDKPSYIRELAKKATEVIKKL